MSRIHDIRIREGETYEVTFTDTDLEASSVVMTITDASDTVILTTTASFTTVDDLRAATIEFEADMPIGEYFYMYRVNYVLPRNLTIPGAGDCGDGDCGLPKFIICDANDKGSL